MSVLGAGAPSSRVRKVLIGVLKNPPKNNSPQISWKSQLRPRNLDQILKRKLRSRLRSPRPEPKRRLFLKTGARSAPQTRSAPDVLGRSQSVPGTLPDVPGALPDVAGALPHAPGCSRTRSASVDATGRSCSVLGSLPERSRSAPGAFPERSRKAPGRSRTLPDTQRPSETSRNLLKRPPKNPGSQLNSYISQARRRGG